MVYVVAAMLSRKLLLLANLNDVSFLLWSAEIYFLSQFCFLYDINEGEKIENILKIVFYWTNFCYC